MEMYEEKIAAKKRVLIVDDIRTDLHYVGKLITGYGYEAVLSDSAPAALELIDEKTDLIIVDGLMPDMDGFDFVESVRNNPFISHIPVIMVTSLSGKNDRLRAVEAGINDFITKPVDKVELKVRADSMLKMKDAQDNVRRYQKELESLVEKKTWALNETLQKLQAVLDGMTDCMVTVDQEFLIKEVNHAFQSITGKTTGELKDSLFFELLAGEEQIDSFKGLFSCADESCELDIEFPQWGRKTFSVLVTAMRGGGHILMMRDITEKKQADEQRARFLSILSHELRTPLNGIKGFSELMMLDSDKFENEHVEYIRFINTCGCQLESIVEELLRFVQFYDSVDDHHEADIRLDILTSYVVDSLSDKISDKQIHMNVSVEGAEPTAHGKNEHFAEVFKQIVDNAVKFSPENGEISITLITGTEDVRFICRDYGIGIPEHAIERVFESFYQVEDYSTRTSEGLGLGLTISKKIIELYNGRIDIVSSKGKGTTMTVIIPLSK